MSRYQLSVQKVKHLELQYICAYSIKKIIMQLILPTGILLKL